jgi:hypothetical protein
VLKMHSKQTGTRWRVPALHMKFWDLI